MSSENETGDAVAQKDVPRSKKQQNDKISFIDLPRELRDLIYAEVLQEKRVRLEAATQDIYLQYYSLMWVSQQIREEFSEEARCCDVVARVTDFNFQHIVTWLNKMPDIDMFEPRKHKKVARITLELDFLARNTGNAHLLERWLRRMINPQKRGRSLEIEYVLHRGGGSDCYFLVAQNLFMESRRTLKHSEVNKHWQKLLQVLGSAIWPTLPANYYTQLSVE